MERKKAAEERRRLEEEKAKVRIELPEAPRLHATRPPASAPPRAPS